MSESLPIAPDLLEILCCPETHQKLKPADSALIQKLNSQISADSLRNRAGNPVTEPLNSGLIRDDGKYLYPIHHNLPIMLVDEAIPL